MKIKCAALPIAPSSNCFGGHTACLYRHVLLSFARANRAATATPRPVPSHPFRSCLAHATLPATLYTLSYLPLPVTSPSAIERDALKFADPARGETNGPSSGTTTGTNGASSGTTTWRMSATVTAHRRHGRNPVCLRRGRRGATLSSYLCTVPWPTCQALC